MDRSQSSLSVTGMSCGGCENAVKRTLMKLDGVRAVTASHAEADGRRQPRPGQGHDRRDSQADARRCGISRAGERCSALDPFYGRELGRGRPAASRRSASAARRSAASSSGSTRTSPTTDMKLVSPVHRGTTWMCRWSAMPAPAGRPRFMPDVQPLRPVRLGERHLRAPRQRASARPVPPGVASASVATWRFGTTIRWPLLYGIEVEDDEAGRAAEQHERLGRPRRACASQKTQPCGLAAAAHVGEPPRRPQAFHGG